tara:strand:+ start:210 stop:785 length:576 start_codon:yes stop_codon:yes gene_type:complete
MEIDNFIKVYDEVIHFERVASLVKYAANKVEFKDAAVFGNSKEQVIEKNTRRTKIYSFNPDSLSSAHWGQYIRYKILEVFKVYNLQFKAKGGTCATKVSSIDLLKYEEGGFYTVHSDHHASMPRTLSVILFLNNDYEGGELNFHDPLTNKIYQTIKPSPGRLVMWPSNFMYPHSVSPVTKGTRYAIVSWLT